MKVFFVLVAVFSFFFGASGNASSKVEPNRQQNTATFNNNLLEDCSRKFRYSEQKKAVLDLLKYARQEQGVYAFKLPEEYTSYYGRDIVLDKGVGIEKEGKPNEVLIALIPKPEGKILVNYYGPMRFPEGYSLPTCYIAIFELDQETINDNCQTLKNSRNKSDTAYINYSNCLFDRKQYLVDDLYSFYAQGKPEGTIHFSLSINKNGAVKDVKLIEKSLLSEKFIAKLIEHAKSLKFESPIREITVPYKLQFTKSDKEDNGRL